MCCEPLPPTKIVSPSHRQKHHPSTCITLFNKQDIHFSHCLCMLTIPRWVYATLKHIPHIPQVLVPCACTLKIIFGTNWKKINCRKNPKYNQTGRNPRENQEIMLIWGLSFQGTIKLPCVTIRPLTPKSNQNCEVCHSKTCPWLFSSP